MTYRRDSQHNCVCMCGGGGNNHFLTRTKNNVDSGYMHEMDLLILSHSNFTFRILWELATKIKMSIQGPLMLIPSLTLSFWRGPHKISLKNKSHRGATLRFHIGRPLHVKIFNVSKIDMCHTCSILIQFGRERRSKVFWKLVKGHQDLKTANQPSLTVWATPYTRLVSKGIQARYERH